MLELGTVFSLCLSATTTSLLASNVHQHFKLLICRFINTRKTIFLRLLLQHNENYWFLQS